MSGVWQLDIPLFSPIAIGCHPMTPTLDSLLAYSAHHYHGVEIDRLEREIGSVLDWEPAAGGVLFHSSCAILVGESGKPPAFGAKDIYQCAGRKYAAEDAESGFSDSTLKTIGERSSTRGIVTAFCKKVRFRFECTDPEDVAYLLSYIPGIGAGARTRGQGAWDVSNCTLKEDPAGSWMTAGGPYLARPVPLEWYKSIGDRAPAARFVGRGAFSPPYWIERGPVAVPRGFLIEEP